MTPDRWQQITAVFHDVLSREPAARDAFLHDACAGDGRLREEVERLLAAHHKAGQFGEPIVQSISAVSSPDLATGASSSLGQARTLPGQGFGSYVLLYLLGKGGMGEVYRARDRKLGRDVAIKTLPAELARDGDRLTRFHSEARMLAALNHPNIAAIYGLEDHGGQTLLIMELVEGETLAERLARTGPFPVDDAMRVAEQVAEAMEAAHAKGIIHRDLKPANVKVTPDGRVKVLDFGLAKSRLPDRPAPDGSLGSSFTGLETEPGILIGTPSYMSPEQVRGQASDRGADVWAFGCVLYELLSAKRVFCAPTLADTFACVLQQQPDWSALPPAVPDTLKALLAGCLEKDQARRWQSFTDVRARLGHTGSGTVGLPRARSRIAGVVVLPLRNLSGDPAQEFFADGMTEALIWDLGKLRSLRVISRTSTLRYKVSDKSLAEIARELNVDAVIEGSVVRDGRRVVIRAQLIQAATETMLWSETYDRDLKDVLILQSEIARAIVTAIQVAVTPEESRELAASPRTVDPTAYENYLKGQFHWGRLTPQGLEAALDYFERTRDKEPALGYVGIAAVWLARQQMNLTPPDVAGPLAREAALRALQADESLPEVHYINALSRWAVDWDWEGARAAFRRTLALRPGFAEARAYQSHFLAVMNEPREAVLEMQRALEIDPHNLLFKSLYGIVLVFAREYDKAIETFQEVQSVQPVNPVIARGLLCAFHLKGMFAEALAQQKAWFTSVGDDEVVAALGRTTNYADAMYGAAEILAGRARRQFYCPSDIMVKYVCAGRKQEALDWLEIAFEQHDPDLPYLRNPINDPIRDEPRYQAILGRMNLAAARESAS